MEKTVIDAVAKEMKSTKKAQAALKNLVNYIEDLHVKMNWEEIERMRRNNVLLMEQLEEMEKGIILSEDNANRDGRMPVLTNEDVKHIKKLRNKGLSYREIEIEIKYKASHETIRQAIINPNFVTMENKKAWILCQ